VDIARNQREEIERLCPYMSRPPVTMERLALTASGQVPYTLKKPYQVDITHIVLEQLGSMARLAAPVPPPRVYLKRYHCMLNPQMLFIGVMEFHETIGPIGLLFASIPNC
jgi:hypothetical protein